MHKINKDGNFIFIFENTKIFYQSLKILDKNGDRKINPPTSLSTLNNSNQKNDNKLSTSRTLLTEVNT
jgi:hypothetical protein